VECGIEHHNPNPLNRKFMVFNATFNNISVILWWLVLLFEEIGENHGQAGKSLTKFIK
jgi:hypothetical protein